jgi:peptidoglycan endopeptidase LytE
MTGAVIVRVCRGQFDTLPNGMILSATQLAVALALALILVGHTGASANGEADSYLVVDGDTLTSIAAETGVPIERLVELNDLADPETILAGATLRLSGSPGQSREGDVVHEVQAGETVFGIADHYGVQPEDIIALNRLALPAYIRPGEYLTVPRPADASQPQVAGSSAEVVWPVPTIALQFRGAPYSFGGAAPDGFDCSGFVYFVLTRAGLPIERDIWSQYESGGHPDRHQLLAGDLVFFQDTYGTGLSHNGIYLGNGQFIHAANEDTGVAVSNLAGSYWEGHWLGATRPNR